MCAIVPQRCQRWHSGRCRWKLLHVGRSNSATTKSGASPSSARTTACSHPLNADIGAVDDPLILATNMFLASDADPLNTVVEAAYEAVSAYDEVISCLTSTDEDIAYDAVKA